MNNKKRDVKFIIYQALYIFVICVVTIKGATLTLVEVVDIKHGWTYVDTTNKVLIDRNDYAKLKEFDPEDPVKYDFALFGLGVNEKF